MTEKLTNKELLEELSKRGYFASKVPPQVSGTTFEPDITKLTGNKYRFAVISCTHLGSRFQQHELKSLLIGSLFLLLPVILLIALDLLGLVKIVW
jgi:hypothetical protein